MRPGLGARRRQPPLVAAGQQGGEWALGPPREASVLRVEVFATLLTADEVESGQEHLVVPPLPRSPAMPRAKPRLTVKREQLFEE